MGGRDEMGGGVCKLEACLNDASNGGPVSLETAFLKIFSHGSQKYSIAG